MSDTENKNTDDKPDPYDDGIRFNPDPLANVSEATRKWQEEFAKQMDEHLKD